MTRAPKRPMSVNASAQNPPAGIACWTISLRVRGRQPGAESETRPLPPRAAAAVHSSAAPGMPGLPAITFTAACHLWASTARCGHQSATSDPSTRWHAMWSVPSPMSATTTSPASVAPRAKSRPGLYAWNVIVRSADSTPSPGCAGERVDAARDVDGQHRRVADRRRTPRPTGVRSESGAERGVDHEIGRGQLRWALGRVEHPHADAARFEPAGCVAPVGAVVAPARDHVDDATVGATEQVDRLAASRRPRHDG